MPNFPAHLFILRWDVVNSFTCMLKSSTEPPVSRQVGMLAMFIFELVVGASLRL